MRLARGQGTLRQATRADVAGIQRVRRLVRENVLISCVITDEQVVDYLERFGRGWVVVDERNAVLGFGIGDARDGNIWALFVDPAHEGRGYGRGLHDVMVEWLFSQGLRRLWLSTEPGTRAERFYRCAGWTDCGLVPKGERRFEMVLESAREDCHGRHARALRRNDRQSH